MPDKSDKKIHARMVVEEIDIPEKTAPHSEEERPEEAPKEDILEESASDVVTEEPKEEPKAEENIPQSESPKEPEKEEAKKQMSPVFWILIPGIFILGAILGGIVFYQKGVDSISPSTTPTPVATTTSEESATPTPEATVDVSEYDVAVYNGSGTAGEAGVVKDLLTEAGFTVVSTGNAATYDYTKTIVKAKSTVDDAVIQKLKDALSDTYVIGEDQTLSSSTTTDIQVVVGSSKAE